VEKTFILLPLRDSELGDFHSAIILSSFPGCKAGHSLPCGGVVEASC
jgi:hypothetical protein